MTEKEKLEIVVNDFMDKMKLRLFEQVDKGYIGWADGYPLESLWQEIYSDSGSHQKPIDIGTRAMMIWFRDQDIEYRQRFF